MAWASFIDIRRRLWAATILLGMALVFMACSVPIASDLEESQANRIIVALDQAGVFAEKELDPANEGRFRVLVGREDSARALTTMREEDLPPPPTAGILETMGKGSLVPSQLAEHAQYVAGVAGELEATIREIAGVQSARVHLSLPRRDSFGDGPRESPTASVLVKHRGSTPPIDAQNLRLLVAGAAPGLLAENIAVVMLPRPAQAASQERELARLGPLSVTRGSLGWLRLGVIVTALIHLASAGVILALWMRLRRLRTEAAPVVELPVEKKRAA